MDEMTRGYIEKLEKRVAALERVQVSQDQLFEAIVEILGKSTSILEKILPDRARK